ncbi:PSD1 and planctomycete cytochrome C domain-containing protein [Gemmatimonas phototrophica]|uniref:PSD1 and planctomycete cytochrome C domain-containing protein n=1 Tax=Gemmatimonas phototrophica TaxID=1379270 RepID=UPI0006A74795|nr:PSD1 and planctomycete cytochrome C domain-containing protein [Gemmatimonas phototrophica]
MKSFVTLVASFATAVTAGTAVATPAAAQSNDDFFETRVRPVLARQCAECHSEARTRGRLRVTSRAELLAGGKSGPAIVPGDPNASLLIKAIRHEIAKMEMPRDAPPLSPREIEGLVEWVKMGAPWPEAAPKIVLAASVSGEAEGGMTPGARIFANKVRPVLEQKCFACHTNEERGGLRLDSRERILKGGGRGPAVIPGNPEQSLIISALRHEREELRMPRNAAKLSDAEIQGFVEWIQAGAEWAKTEAPIAVPRRAATKAEREFWSFSPHPVIKVPTPKNTEWVKTDIDRFVLAQLEQRGLTPARAADKRTLIRRATYDLIGLPPTKKEVEAFLADTARAAFEKVVDRLLASEHYGEKWGRHWLDVTRYAEDDTRGLAMDGSGRERYPMAHVYRDWVVDALNADMAYDTLVMAHLAADQMPENRRKDLLPALGFLGQGPWYYDLADPPVARADERHDRVDVTTRGFLGITVGCARCHDHKYDPIGTHDYYALAGVFNNANYHEYPIADSVRADKYKKDKEFIKKFNEGMGEYMRTESDQLARVLTLQVSKYMMAAWQVTGREQLPKERAALEARLDLETLERWIDFLNDPPKHYPFLTDWQAMIAEPVGTTDEAKAEAKKKAQKLADAFQRLLLDVTAEQKKLEEKNKKIIAKGTPLEEVKSIPMPNGFESFFDQHQLELATMDRSRFNLYLDVYAFDLDNELDTFFPKPALLRFNGWGLERQLSRVAADHLAAMREEVKRLEKELPDIPFVMGVKDKPKESLEDIALHIRGSPLNLGERVPRGFPLVLQNGTATVYKEGSGRLQLAQDIAKHPLAARVIVNRVWGWHMGAGIVRTPSNFGFAGARPTNPELLEYLATQFVANGRSIKRLHKDIMLSSVYQMASDHDAKAATIDPENQNFWRFNRQRLSAEGIRDALLAVSGELADSIGGPSLELDDEKNNRRTLYSSVSRFQPHIFLQTFDFPSPSLSAERRFATNVPLQSLYFMNSPFVLRQAQALVRRLADSAAAPVVAKDSGTAGAAPPRRTALKKAATTAADTAADAAGPPPPKHFDDRAMIRAAYPLLYGRDAVEEEIVLGLGFLAEQRASLLASETAKAEAETKKVQSSTTATAKVAGAGGGAEQAKKDLLARRVSMKAWTQYARALFSAAEFRFID